MEILSNQTAWFKKKKSFVETVHKEVQMKFKCLISRIPSSELPPGILISEVFKLHFKS